ncbi:MAG: phosphoribosylformylglycinamidine synthase subunit PurQ [Bdellovibrionaceae bacterium]|nr:phosphoribosylformylglycinamidine synthase subunit PurQ [Pseudobdellovibrionaceae bacterium]
MSARKVGVLRFPGTNCDRDVWQAIEMSGGQPEWLWHADLFDPSAYARLILPGGFSYGDYLRSGALAARAKAMQSVREAAERGVPVLGICNGFQILTEAKLLPGALIKNESLRFNDDWVGLRMRNSCRYFASQVASQVASQARSAHVMRLPIAHADGRYYAEDDELKRLEDNGQIWLTYEKNPNGSIADIAGVMNASGNVAALMPHPERAMADWMGGHDGLSFFMHGE